ncbi:YrzI family small protein [Alkalihalobacillus pseudalcaliphilus]|nr:YrzI family small protein [Alkalihalobacillus pseudalcaliphilus]
MTFQFLIFTITVKKRAYSEAQLKEFIRQEQFEHELSHRRANIQLYR